MPFLAGWGKRKAVKYGTVFPGANLTDFPKLLNITADNDIKSEISGGGGFAVTEADGQTLVPFGVYPYPYTDATLGNFLLRAKFPTLLTGASTGDVLGYLYYDSGQTTSEDKASVMDGNYLLFMTLEEDPSGSAPQERDWVTDTLVGTSSGSMGSGDLVAGQVGGALHFDGIDDAVAYSDASLATGSFDTVVTLEAWLRPASFANFDQPISNGNGFDHTGYGFNTRVADTVSFFLGVWNVEYSGSAPADTWTLAAGTHRGDTGDTALYVNGSLADSGNRFGTSVAAPGDVLLGAGLLGTYYSGRVDEVRISSVVRSADWLAYAYQDEASNADTFSLGTEETAGGGGGPFPHFLRGCLTGGMSLVGGGPC